MRRRKFLYGLGATAAGGAALMGTGAFTTGSLGGREANIDVVNDSDGVLSLLSMQPNSGMIYENDSGRLEVDFTAGGAEGANVGGRFQLGYLPGDSNLARRAPDSPDWGERTLEDDYPSISDDLPDHTWYNSAFAVWNRGTQTYDLTFTYDAEKVHGSKLKLHIFNGDDAPHEYGTLVVDSNDPASLTVEADAEPEDKQFSHNKRIFGTLEAMTEDGKTWEDLSGTLTITADNPR